MVLSLGLSAIKSIFSFKLIQVPSSTTFQEDLQTTVEPPNEASTKDIRLYFLDQRWDTVF